MKKIASIGLLGAALLLGTAAAQAATTYTGEGTLTPFTRYWTNFTAGTSYTVETANLTAGGDTVLHVLYWNGSSYQQIAANDDSVGLASKVVFSAPYTSSNYLIWIRSYSDAGAGKADLKINGSTVLTQSQFGGNVVWMNWNAGEQFRVANTRFTGSADEMVFLLRSNTEFLQFDDDTGPSVSPFATASTTETGGSARVVFGLYSPSSVASYGRLIVQPAPTAATDPDGDGLTTALESLIGTSGSNSDSDNDGIPDGIEAIGGSDTFYYTMSRSASAPYGNNPTRRNANVEIDYMVNSADATKTRQPYANLPTDARDIFTADGNSDLTVVIDGSLTWHQNLGLDGCDASWPDCVDFRTVKASDFSSGYPERRPYFHYNIWGYQYNNGCSSGLSEILGNDFIVSLGCWSSPSVATQRGTFIHEFGHNLNLTHNGNGNNNGNNSTVHNSVMNYRYQMNGTSPSGRHTYSTGAGGCAACATSPKQACINLNSAGQCGTAAGATCDCDLNEWNSAINYDMTEGGAYNDGVAYTAAASVAAPVAEPLNVVGKAVDLAKVIRQNPAAEKLAAKVLADSKLAETDVKATLAKREAAALKPNAEKRRASVVKRVATLKGQGQIEGVDFWISSDGTAIFAE